MQRRCRGERRDSLASKQVTAKLLKFIVTKLNGTDLDWFRFLNQFQGDMDSNATISNLTKFSYLKEPTVTSVSASI